MSGRLHNMPPAQAKAAVVAEPRGADQQSRLSEAFAAYAQALPTNRWHHLIAAVRAFTGARQATLRVGTACSGSDGIMLVIQEFSRLVGRQGSLPMKVVQVFACENVAWKQEWIRCMFPAPHGPAAIFDDIASLGCDRGYDVLSSSMVPVEAVDLLVAGISCRDASLLSSRRSERLTCVADGSGTTGSTAAGLLAYVRRHLPPFIIVENVVGLGRDSDHSEGDAEQSLGAKRFCPEHRRQSHAEEWRQSDAEEQRQSHAEGLSGGSNTDILLAQLRKVGYAAACVSVQADEFGSIAPRQRLYFAAVNIAGSQLTSDMLRQQLQADLAVMRIGAGSVEKGLASLDVAAEWLHSLPRRRANEEDERCQWRKDHEHIFGSAGLPWPPKPTPEQAAQSCWKFLNHENLSVLTPREQEVIQYFLLRHVPSDFEDASGRSRIWAFELYHNLNRTLHRSPRGRCKPLVTVLPHSNMFLVMSHMSRLAVPPELFAFQGFFLEDYGMAVHPAAGRRRGPVTARNFAMSYRDAADLMGNAFNLFATSAFLCALALHFDRPAKSVALSALPQCAPATCVRDASGRLAGRIRNGVAQCALHPRCCMPGGLACPQKPWDDRTLQRWLQAGFDFTTRLAHQAVGPSVLTPQL